MGGEFTNRYSQPGLILGARTVANAGKQEIRVNWAYQSNSSNKEDTSSHFHIFVGDLSNEVNDEVLLQAFSAFGSVSEARVMWDMKTGRSRGYGFVAFRDRPEAEKALSSMDGEWLGSRAIRCNWANQKGQPSMAQQQAMQAMGMTPTTPYGHHQFPAHGVASYEVILGQTPNWQTTCYVGNLTPYTTPNDVVPLFQNFGFVQESRFHADRGFAFIKMDTHENAAMAICQMNGYNVNGRPLKCSVSLSLCHALPARFLLLTLLPMYSGARTRHPTLETLIHLSSTALRALRPLAVIPGRPLSTRSTQVSSGVGQHWTTATGANRRRPSSVRRAAGQLWRAACRISGGLRGLPHGLCAPSERGWLWSGSAGPPGPVVATTTGSELQQRFRRLPVIGKGEATAPIVAKLADCLSQIVVSIEVCQEHVVIRDTCLSMFCSQAFQPPSSFHDAYGSFFPFFFFLFFFFFFFALPLRLSKIGFLGCDALLSCASHFPCSTVT